MILVTLVTILILTIGEPLCTLAPLHPLPLRLRPGLHRPAEAGHHTILYYTILYYTILYYTILYYTIITVLYYTKLNYTILYYTILYYTILYYCVT